MLNRIKQSLLLRVKRLFYYLGFNLERIPNENQFFNELHTAPEAIRVYLLKKRASEIRVQNNHKEYNKLLKRLVPNWDIVFTKAQFLGQGRGMDNLCVYRKVYFNSKYYFEKVYFNDPYIFLQKNIWICDDGYSILESYLKIPKLYKIIKGDFVSITYFEFIELANLPSEEQTAVMFNISKIMFNISRDFNSVMSTAPSFLRDYRLHEYYNIVNKKANKMIEELSEGRLTMNKIETLVKPQPLMFTHGDMHRGNVLLNNYIIDWDDCGFFPRGFETAAIFATSGEIFTLKQIQDTLFIEYNELIPNGEWESFEFTCLYFYLIFTVIHEESQATVTLQKDVFRRVDELFEKINK